MHGSSQQGTASSSSSGSSSRSHLAQCEWDQKQRGSEHPERLEMKTHSRSRPSAQDEGDPDSAEKLYLWIVSSYIVRNLFGSVLFSFCRDQACNHACQICGVNADATNATKRSVLYT